MLNDGPVPPIRGRLRARAAVSSGAYANGTGRPEEEDLTIRRIERLFRRRRWTIFNSIVAIVGLVTLLTYFWPKTYESSATLIVDRPSRGHNVPALAVLERADRVDALETEVELIKSRRVLEMVVDSLDLNVGIRSSTKERLPEEPFAHITAGPDATPGTFRISRGPDQVYVIRDVDRGRVVATLRPASTARFSALTMYLPAVPRFNEVVIRIIPFDEAVAAAQKRLTVSIGHRNANLIRLACRGPTATEAQKLCEAVSQSYLQLRANLQASAVGAAARFLQEQVERTGERLVAAEDSVEAFKRRNRIVRLEEQASAEVRRFAQLEAERDQLLAERAALRDLTAAIESGQRGSQKYEDLASFPTFLRNQALTGLVQNLVELENRRSDLALRRMDENVELVALDARISAIEYQLRSFAEAYEQALTVQINSLESTLAHTGQRLAVIPTRQAEAARLERKASLFKELNVLLETRLREAEVAQAMNLPSVSIVDSASRPVWPSAPNARLNVGLGLVLGVALGLFLAAYKEHSDTRIHERQELALETDLPVLGMLPKVRDVGLLLPVSQANGHEGGAEPHGLMVSQPRSARPRFSWGRSGRFITEANERHVALEAFRSLGADLKVIGRGLNNGGLKSLMVTSAGPAEGKTFVACNLALARANRGTRTLLIDADMRASGVAKLFDLPLTSAGLSDVLAGSADPQAVWKRFQLDGPGELFVLPAGRRTSRFDALLEDPELARLLAQVQALFDLVIIDTPPLNVLSDAAVIAANVDAVMLVVRVGVTEREAFELTLERLERAKGPVIGVVLNGVVLPAQYARYTYTEVLPTDA
jgi:succinoglycan biosynthesis transport protein ExoP